jgi:hypothetical protein
MALIENQKKQSQFIVDLYNKFKKLGSSGPTKYKVYVALLRQIDENAPQAIVLEDSFISSGIGTTGIVKYDYEVRGQYRLFIEGFLFQPENTFIFVGRTSQGLNRSDAAEAYVDPSKGVIIINSFDLGSGAANNMLLNTPIEIRVYN